MGQLLLKTYTEQNTTKDFRITPVTELFLLKT